MAHVRLAAALLFAVVLGLVVAKAVIFTGVFLARAVSGQAR